MHRSLSDSHWGPTSPHPFLQRDKFCPLSLRTAGPPPPSWALPGCLKDPWLSTCSSPVTRLQVILHGICLASLCLSLSLSVSLSVCLSLSLSLSLSHTHTYTHTPVQGASSMWAKMDHVRKTGQDKTRRQTWSLPS